MVYGLYLYKDLRSDLRLEIWRKDWMLGAIEIAAMDSTPIELVGLDNSGSDILTPIIKSSVNVNIKNLGEINYEEFFTADATKFKVIIKEGGEQIWGGYITPDSYSQPYEYRTSIRLIARDNLGMLDQLDYDWFDSPLVSPSDLIIQAQTKIGWAMKPIAWLFQRYISSVGVEFKNAEINVKMFRDKTWWEVLEMVLLSGGQQMRYIGGNQMAICNVSDIHNLYSLSPSKEITHSIGSSAQMEITPSWRELTIKQDYGIIDDLINYSQRQSNFEYIEDSPYGVKLYQDKSMEQSFVANPYDYENAATSNSEFYGCILYPRGSLNGIYKTLHIADYEKGLEVNFEVYNFMAFVSDNYFPVRPPSDAKPVLRRFSSDLLDGAQIIFKARVLFKDENTGKLSYMTSVDGGGWTEDIFTIELPLPVYKEQGRFTNSSPQQSPIWLGNGTWNDELIKWAIKIQKLPAAKGELAIEIAPPGFVRANGDVNGINVDASLVIIKKFTLKRLEECSAGTEFKGRVNEQGNVKESIDIAVGEVPINSGDYLAYAGGLFESDKYHKALTGWHRKDDKGGVLPLSELVGRGYAHHFVAFKNINGERTGGKVITANIDFNDSNAFVGLYVINGEDYILNSARCNLLRKTAEVTLRQVLPYEHQEGEYDANAVDGGGGSTIGGGDNTVVLWGTENGGIHSTKRTYQLPTNGNLSDLFVLTDKVGDPTASKVPLSSLMNKSHAASHAKGGTDPITPASIGAAEEVHNHDDKYHPKGGDVSLEFAAKKIIAETIEAEVVESQILTAKDAEVTNVTGINATFENIVATQGITAPMFTVRMMAATGGIDITSAANAKLTNVVDGDDYWQCFYKCAGQLWKPLDQARIQSEFGGFLWGLVTAASEQPNDRGEYSFNISKTTVANGSNATPKLDDVVVLYGHRGADKYRQSLFIKSCGVDNPDEDYEPYEAKYVAIDSFSLPKSKCIKWDGLTFDIAVNSFAIRGRDGNLRQQPNDRGGHVSGTTYYAFDRVSRDGSVWQCVADSTTTTPSDGASDWVCVVLKGSKGDAGGKGDYLVQGYCWAENKPQRPVGSSPEGWNAGSDRGVAIVDESGDNSAEAGDILTDGSGAVLLEPYPASYRLWGSTATFDAETGEVVGEWSDPYQVSGEVGADGQTPIIYSLAPSATAVKKDKAGVVSPANVSCRAMIKIGNEREIIGVDPKIDFKGRNLIPATTNHWKWLGQHSLFQQAVEMSSSATYVISGRYNEGNRVNLYSHGTYVGSVGIQCDAPYTVTNITTAEFLFPSLAEIKSRQPKLELSSVATDWTPAPEDYAIQRNGEAYTAGAAVTPSDTVNWTLHDPAKPTTAEPIDRASTIFSEDIEVGGVNLALNSQLNITTNQEHVADIELSRDLKDGEVITITVEGETNNKQFIIKGSPIATNIVWLNTVDRGKCMATFAFSGTPENLRNKISLYAAGGLWVKVRTIKVERGNRATDWSPAPEDTQAEINAAKAEALKLRLFRGEFKAGTVYFNNNSRQDIVRYENIWYSYIGADGVAASWSAANWKSYLLNAESIATELLLAEEANIANFLFRGGKLTSQTLGEDGTPNLSLDGINGIVKATEGNFGSAYFDSDGTLTIREVSGATVSTFTRGDINTLSELLEGNELGSSALTGFSDSSGASDKFEVSVTLGGSITTSKANADVTVSGVEMTAWVSGITQGFRASARAELFNDKGEVFSLGFVRASIDSGIRSESKTIQFTGKMATAGIYRVRVVYSMNGSEYGEHASANISVSGGTISKLFTKATNESQLGRGVAVIFDALNYLHYGNNPANNNRKELVYKGYSNLPGVLAKARVMSNGAIVKAWGAYKITAVDNTTIGGANKRVYHNIGNDKYTAMCTAYGGGSTPVVYNETAAYVDVYANGSFNIMLIGDN